jgi:hypothetical protein
MRRGLTALTLMLALILAAGLSPASPADLQKGSDGSLVLAGDSRSKAASGDTLYELQAREVHAYISKYKTWIWNRGVVRRPFLASSSRPLAPNPQLEMMISKYAGHYGVDPALVRAVMRHESGFNSQAVSPKGAQGLMQLMPGTAALMGVSNPFDPEQNIAGGVGYLRFCLDQFQHNVPLAVAAYNAGPQNVAKYGCTVPPFAETQNFVQNVMGTYTGTGKAPPGKVRPGARGAAGASKDGSQKEETAKENKPRPRAKIIEVRPGQIRTVQSPGTSSPTHSARIIEVKSTKSKVLTLRTVKD